VLSTELRILIRDTGRVWWRLLAVILGVYLMGGIRVFQTFRLWLRDRAVSYAVAHRGPGRSRSLLCHLQNRPAGDPVESLGIVLRAALFWLAVAALVFGSRILSLPRYGTRASPTLHVSLAPRPLPGTATSERSVAWDHRRKAFAWLRLGYRRHSSATLMTNTCRRSSADAQLGRAAPAQCRKRWCRTDAVLRQEQLQSLEDDSSQRLTAPFAWPTVYGGSSGRSYSRKPTA
jgi:hypothetical protein